MTAHNKRIIANEPFKTQHLRKGNANSKASGKHDTTEKAFRSS